MKQDRLVKIILISVSLIFLAAGIVFENYHSEKKAASTAINKPGIKPAPAHIPRAASPSLPLKYIYLTFDDGPLFGSENIDSLVLAEKLKINVFLVGRNVRRSSILDSFYELYRHNPYIESYNHSYSHANNKYDWFYRNPQNVLADIEKNEQALNLPFKIVRLPGRNMWRVGGRSRNDVRIGISSADTLAKHGYKVFGWDYEWQHNRNGEPIQTVDSMYNEIVWRLEKGRTFTKDHLVLLLHDEMFQKPGEESKLKHLIDTLRTHPNYEFDHIRFYPDK